MIIIVAVVVCVIAGSCEAFNTRIVNGTDAREGEFPYAVSLRNNNRHTCGGTILNANYILTAAHCICNNNIPNDARNYTIQYGLLNITTERVNVIQVAEIFCHNFNYSRLIYDAAVLRLEQPLASNVTWAPVKLARNFQATGTERGVIIGWGRLLQGGPLPETLQKLTVDIYTDTVCNRIASYNISHHVCFGAHEAGACNGDSGTALMVNGEQVGIASYITQTCGIANQTYPNVYAKIPSYYDWIVGISGQELVKMSPLMTFLGVTIALVLYSS